MLIFEDKDGDTLRECTKAEFIADDNKAQQIEFHTLQKKDEPELFVYCSCQGKSDDKLIPMNLRKNVYVSPVNYDGNGPKHVKSCDFFAEAQLNTNKYHKGIVQVDKGDGEKVIRFFPDQTMRMHPREIAEKRAKELQRREEKSKEPRPKSSKKTIDTESFGYAGLTRLAGHLSMMAHESLVTRNNPTYDIWAILRIAYGHANNIELGNELLINSYYPYFPSQVRKLKPNEDVFVFFPLVEIRESTFGKYGDVIEGEFDIIMHKETKRGIVDIYNVRADDYLLDEAESNYKNSYKFKELRKYEDVSGRYPTIVAGLGRKHEKYNHIELYSLRFLPITKWGLFVESDNERDVFEHFVSESILAKKPYVFKDYYNGWLPDIEFIIPKTPGKPFIGEVFGMEGVPSYDERTAKKKMFASESDEFDFWCWNVKSDKRIPSVY